MILKEGWYYKEKVQETHKNNEVYLNQYLREIKIFKYLKNQ